MYFHNEEFAPHPILKEYISKYLLIQGNFYDKETPMFSYFPTFNPILCIQLEEDLNFVAYLNNTSKQELPRVFVTGVTTCIHSTAFMKKFSVLVIQFNSWAFHSLLNECMKHFVDVNVSNDDFETKNKLFFRSLVDQYLNGSHNKLEMISQIETFFIKKVQNMKIKPWIVNAVEFVQQRNANISVKAVAKCLAVSERKLERIFKEQLGISPKKYLMLARFNMIMHQIKYSNGSQIKTNEILNRFDYYDQAHFINELNQFTGYSPSSFKKDEHPLLKTFF